VRAQVASRFLVLVLVAAGLAVVGGWGAKLALEAAALKLHASIQAAIVLAVFGALYLAITSLLGLAEARALTGRLLRRLRR
jgi:hypothetical protein